jgi:hypothetical protein
MKLRRIEKLALQFTTSTIDGTRPALLLKLNGDRLQKFAAQFRRQRSGGVVRAF